MTTRRLRRMWLDAVIGWNQGQAERFECRAVAARGREARARREYRRRFSPGPMRFPRKVTVTREQLR